MACLQSSLLHAASPCRAIISLVRSPAFRFLLPAYCDTSAYISSARASIVTGMKPSNFRCKDPLQCYGVSCARSSAPSFRVSGKVHVGTLSLVRRFCFGRLPEPLDDLAESLACSEHLSRPAEIRPGIHIGPFGQQDFQGVRITRWPRRACTRSSLHSISRQWLRLDSGEVLQFGHSHRWPPASTQSCRGCLSNSRLRRVAEGLS